MENIIELDNLKMKTIQEVANCNTLVASMKAEMKEIEKNKETFLLKQEEEVLQTINNLLNNSKELLDETNSNYIKVHQFYEILKDFSEYISETHKDLTKNIEDFRQKSVLWQEEIKNQEKEIEKQKKELLLDTQSLNREKDFIKTKKLELKKDREYLESQQVTLQTSYNELKKLWDKTLKT